VERTRVVRLDRDAAYLRRRRQARDIDLVESAVRPDPFGVLNWPRRFTEGRVPAVEEASTSFQHWHAEDWDEDSESESETECF